MHAKGKSRGRGPVACSLFRTEIQGESKTSVLGAIISYSENHHESQSTSQPQTEHGKYATCFDSLFLGDSVSTVISH